MLDFPANKEKASASLTNTHKHRQLSCAFNLLLSCVPRVSILPHIHPHFPLKAYPSAHSFSSELHSFFPSVYLLLHRLDAEAHLASHTHTYLRAHAQTRHDFLSSLFLRLPGCINMNMCLIMTHWRHMSKVISLTLHHRSLSFKTPPRV